MLSSNSHPQDKVASVSPCSPEMSIKSTIADGLIVVLYKQLSVRTHQTDAGESALTL